MNAPSQLITNEQVRKQSWRRGAGTASNAVQTYGRQGRWARKEEEERNRVLQTVRDRVRREEWKSGDISGLDG